MKQSVPTPILKPRQVEILLLLHRFRYLNRPQIQALLGHKTWAKVIIWLNDLTDKHYVFRFYEQRMAGKPAVYCLDKASIRYLRELAAREKPPIKVTEPQLKRIYKGKSLSDTFREHCLLIADIYLFLLDKCKQDKSTLTFLTKTDTQYIEYFPIPRPDAYLALKRQDKTERYFLDIFDPLPPRMMLRKRVWQYCNYHSERYWQNEHPDKLIPDVLLVLPEERSKKYIARQTKKIVENEGCEDEILFYVGTWQEVREEGVMDGTVIVRME
jgi:hypothetical protein